MNTKTGDIEKKSNREKGPIGRAPGKGSIMFETLTDLAAAPLLPPIAIMQSALPAVGTAVNRYGLYKRDPQGRAQRTNWSMIRFLYDGGDVAQREAQNLRELHANIKGKLDDGSSYYALNPKTFRIVPDTFLDAVIRIRRDLGTPLSQTEEAQLYEEYRQLCLMLGIPEKYIEPTLEEFYIYYEDLVLNTMTYNETVDFLLHQGIEVPVKLKYLTWLQPLLNAVHHRLIYSGLRLTTVTQLHPLYRERFEIPWTDRDQRSYEKLLNRLKTFAKWVPRPLRYNPTVYLVMLGIHGPGLITFAKLQKIEAKLKARLKAKQKSQSLNINEGRSA